MNDTTHNKGAGHSRAKNGSIGSIQFSTEFNNKEFDEKEKRQRHKDRR